jgi:hypothetical protein
MFKRGCALAPACGLVAVGGPITANARAGVQGPTITFSGPLTEGVVGRTVHPVPVSLRHAWGLESYSVFFDGVYVKGHVFEGIDEDWHGDVGPFDASRSTSPGRRSTSPGGSGRSPDTP